MFKQSGTLLMKGYYIYHRMLTALKHVSVHNSQGGGNPPYSLPICNSYCIEKLNLFPGITHRCYILSENVLSCSSCILNRGQRALVEISKHN